MTTSVSIRRVFETAKRICKSVKWVENFMCCYECSQTGNRREAMGICHHCSVGVCQQHASLISDPVTMTQFISRTIVLPMRARLLLCHVCLAALEQNRTDS
jgi:hypothetical protein